VTDRLTDVQRIHTARQGVQTNDDVHVIALDGIGDNAVQELDLVARVQLGAGNLDSCCIRERDAQRVDANTGKGVDGGEVEEAGIPSLKDGSTALA